MSLVASEPPPRMLACTAAPSATTSSGFRSVCGLRWNSSSTSARTRGMRVDPPTSTDFIDLLGLVTGILHRLLHGTDGAIEDRLNELLELFARDLALVAISVGQARYPALSKAARRAQSWPRSPPCESPARLRRCGEGRRPFAADIVERDRDQQVVDVVAAEVRVAVGRDDFEDAFVQLENRDVERSAAEVVHRDRAVLLLSRP